MTLLIGVGGFAAVYGLGNLLSNAYAYFFIRRESHEQFLYRCFPQLEKLTETELNHIEKVIGKDPRKESYKWMW